jgi:hypothetical protein
MVQAPGLEFAFEARVQVAPAQEVGDTPLGRQRVIPILGGTVEGPRLKADVLPGGADWQIVRPDGVVDLTARYLIRTRDGAMVAVTNHGLRHGAPEAMDRLARGEPVDPALIYFRTAPTFATGDARYQWLNRYIFICTAERAPLGVSIRFFQVN